MVILAVILVLVPLSALISRATVYKSVKITIALISAVISMVSICMLLFDGQSQDKGLINIPGPLIDFNWLIGYLTLLILLYLVYAVLKASNITGTVISLLQLFGYAAFRMLNPQMTGILTIRVDYFSLIPCVLGVFLVSYIGLKGKFDSLPAVTGLISALFIMAVSDNLVWVYFSLSLASACLLSIKGKVRTKTGFLNIQLIINSFCAILIYVLYYMFSISSFTDAGRIPTLFYSVRISLFLTVLYLVYAIAGIYSRTENITI